MPTRVSKPLIDEIGHLIRQHIADTGDSVTAISRRTGLNRGIISRLKNGTMEGSLQFKNAKVILKSLGKRMMIVDSDFHEPISIANPTSESPSVHAGNILPINACSRMC